MQSSTAHDDHGACGNLLSELAVFVNEFRFVDQMRDAQPKKLWLVTEYGLGDCFERQVGTEVCRSPTAFSQHELNDLAWNVYWSPDGAAPIATGALGGAWGSSLRKS